MAVLLLALHLLPGVLFALIFCLLANVWRGTGATAYLALILSIPLCLAPLELGIMLVWSKVIGSASLSSVIGYRARVEALDIILIPLLLLLIFLMMALVTGPLSLRLESNLSSWVPEWLTTGNFIRELSMVSSAKRLVTILLAFVFSGLVAPVIEELYFRGFLLPKMASLGVVAPIASAFLFAIYHFYFPWNVPAIFIVFIPIAYAVWARENILIGIFIHTVINLLGVLQVVWLARVQ